MGVLGLAVLTLAGTAPASPVADAAERGDVESVRGLLEQGADVNAAQADGMTALHWAAERGDLSMTTLLLGAGASHHAVTRIGAYTPLHLAARSARSEVVVALLDGGSDPGIATSSGGATPLHFAALSGDVATVEPLLDRGAEPDVREGQWGQTPLVFAASNNRAAVIRLLLERGADPNLQTEIIDGALQAAIDAKADKVMKDALVLFDPRAGQSPVVSAPSNQVQAAIMAAREVQRNPGSVDRAGGSDRGGFRRPPRIEGGMTALLHAARAGNGAAVEALLEGGADIDLTSGDGTSPLLIATLNGHFDLSMKLVEAGADPNVVNADGWNPLYAAIDVQWLPHGASAEVRAQDQQQTTYMELMKALLDAGANPDARLGAGVIGGGRGNGSRDGASPFWRAAYGVDVEAMRLLVSYGADPNVPTMKPEERRGVFDPYGDEDPSGLEPIPVGGPGVYPIHALSGLEYGEGFEANSHRYVPDAWMPAIRYIVEELRADVNQRDHNGYTALHNAASRGDNEVVLYLIDRGADVSVVSRRGETTVDMANGPYQRISPFPRTIALLESLGGKNNHNCVGC